jgi:2,4-dienoyl-CoA reductase-like NADH-dependent reductase (Old Yellow Enzyme family)
MKDQDNPIADALMRPLRLNDKLTLKNRIVMAPMTSVFCS